MSDLEKLAASFAAEELTSHKEAILTYVKAEDPIIAADLKSAIEKSEPGGFKMALVSSTLNKMLDGLESEEVAAMPSLTGEFLDWAIAKLTAVAKG